MIERHVAAYGLVALLGTVAFGATLSLTVGPRVAEIDWVALASGSAAAVVEATLGLGLVAWGVARPETGHPRLNRARRGTGPTALVALSAILDPTFVSLAVIAGRDGTFWSVVAAHSVWVLVSQAPLVLLLAEAFFLLNSGWWFVIGEFLTGDEGGRPPDHGQTAMGGGGEPRHAGDMAAQLALSLDNLEAVLGEAGMSLANLIRLNVHTTDVDLLFQHYGVLASRLGAAGVAPTTTMLGVTRLAIPDLMVELEGTAVA